MRLREVLTYLGTLLFTCLFIAGMAWLSAYGQITAPRPIESGLFDPDNRPTHEIHGELQWENAYGTTIRTVLFSGDSINVALGNANERRWTISMDSLRAGTGDTTLMLVTVTGEARRGKPAPFTAYKDSLLFQRRMECVNVDFLPGTNVTMEDSVSNNVAVGDTLKLAYYRRSFDQHHKRKTVIFPRTAGVTDTLVPAGDAMYSLAASNNYEFCDLLIDGTTQNTSTGMRIKLAYQLKDNVTGKWMGDANDATRTINDSVFTVDADVTLRRNAWSRIPITKSASDSIRILLYEKSVKGIVIIRGMELVQYN